MKKTLEKPTWRDRQRWFLLKQEKTIEEIAAREGVNPERIQKSIDTVDMYRYAGAFEEVDIEINHAALRLIEDQEQALRSAMLAGKFDKLPDGTIQLLPDHEVRIRAVEVAKDMAVAVRPKAPMNQINVQQNSMNGGSGRSGLSFESILREKRIQREVAKGRDVPMLEAETVEPEETLAEKALADFEDMGIEIDKSDLEDGVDDDGNGETED